METPPTATAIDPEDHPLESAEQLAEELAELVRMGDDADLSQYVEQLEPREAARAVCELSDEDEARLLERLIPQQASALLIDVPEVEAVEAVAALPPETSAAIIQHMPSNKQADLVSALADDEADAILAEMSPTDAIKLQQLVSYDPDTAGGLMQTEVLAFRESSTVAQILQRLRSDAGRFRQLDIQYAYVVARGRKLVGVLRLRDLLLADDSATAGELMIEDPIALDAQTPIAELDEFFDDHAFLGVPVVEAGGRLLGVVTRAAVDEQSQSNAERDYRLAMGVVQEEIRTMPTLKRSRLRLSWLSVNILLNVVAASVIAGFQNTLEQVIALAVFLPIISDMSGCSGNQAVAVSMRELSLGLIEPRELWRVWRKEFTVGILNGLALGILLGAVGWWYAGNPWLGVVVAVALGTNTLVAVLIGSSLPLILKARGVDPALASGPILTTVTDMCGFFLVLGLATVMLEYLV
ncbi:magnesium transporter [Aeoliella sp. ICT_H6.2]|uniref:Magnesium transporter MgtE n=1 Tax=Aeoliella straminimaris TaxID=2954799 RepID=A0A9X2FAP2_9BACT|nr:magnesium transporter [Aeoliella straminimaris]MCO6045482.1 magnesium transporter [Aeoliella straminimaris]